MMPHEDEVVDETCIGQSCEVSEVVVIGLT